MAKKKVSRIDHDVALIKSYVNLDGKKKSNQQIRSLLSRVQKALVEQKVCKSCMYAKEVMKIQDSLIQVVNSKAPFLQISIEPKALMHYEDIAEHYCILVSVSLLKRYINLSYQVDMMRRTSGIEFPKRLIMARAERLQEHFMRASELGFVPTSDKYHTEFRHAFTGLSRFVSGKTKELSIDRAELHGFKELWAGAKNAASKVSSGVKKVTERAKKAVKSKEFQNILDKTKKAGKFVRENSVKAYNISKAAVKAAKAEHDRTKSAAKKKDIPKKEAASPEQIEKFRNKVDEVMDEWKAYKLKDKNGNIVEDKKEAIAIALSKARKMYGNVGGLGHLKKALASAAGSFVESIVTVHLSGPGMKVGDIKNQKFEKIGLLGDYKKLIGDACKPTSIFIYGRGGSGKSTFCLRLSEVLNGLGNSIMYVASEQYGSPTFSELLNRLDLRADDSFVIVPSLDSDSPAKYDFIVLDSKDSCGLKNSDQFEALKKKYPKQSFIITSKGLKNGDFKGDEAWRNNVDTMIHCQKMVAEVSEEKNRWGGTEPMQIK
jgi:hypothetical protein